MDSLKINKILKELESGYDSMVEKFSGTRNFFWPDLAFIADYINEDDRVLDFGCGNGRLLEILKSKTVEYQGVDVSTELIGVAKEKYPKYARGFQKIPSSGSLPFSDEYFNVIISIAVFHHFPPVHARIVAREFHRILAPGGLVIATTWNLEQDKYQQYLAPRGDGLIEGYIPFKDNYGNVFDRYHVAYSQKQLADLFTEAGFRAKRAEIIKGKNMLLICQK